MENITEFQKRFHKLLAEAKGELKISDGALAYILLQQGLGYFFKTLEEKGITF